MVGAFLMEQSASLRITATRVRSCLVFPNPLTQQVISRSGTWSPRPGHFFMGIDRLAARFPRSSRVHSKYLNAQWRGHPLDKGLGNPAGALIASSVFFCRPTPMLASGRGQCQPLIERSSEGCLASSREPTSPDPAAVVRPGEFQYGPVTAQSQIVRSLEASLECGGSHAIDRDDVVIISEPAERYRLADKSTRTNLSEWHETSRWYLCLNSEHNGERGLPGK